MPSQNTLDIIKQITHAGYNSQMTSIGVLDQLQMNQKLHHAIDRANSQADAQLKKCNPDYEPPKKDDDVGDTINIISGNVVADEDAFSNIVDRTCNDPSHKHPTTTQPKAEPEPKPAPQAKPPTDWAKVASLVMGGASLLGIGYGAYQLSRPQYVDVPARSTTIDAEFLSEIEGRLQK